MPSSNEHHPADLFPDYVAECEEHLTAAGRVLLDLEAVPDRFDREQIDGLFRNFHSVKGLSAMVGLHEAEYLAHHLESYLGAVRKGRATLSGEGLSLLVEGVQSLERVIAARWEGLPIPTVEPLSRGLAALLPDQPDPPHAATTDPDPPPSLTEPPNPYSRANAALREGAEVWRVRFVPSPSLTERGWTVNVVRERLRAAGEIVHAEPTVVPGGVTFTFLVAGLTGEFAAGLRDEGLSVESYDPVPAVTPDVTPPAAFRSASLVQAQLVRVDLGRLDELMRTVGELVATRARLNNGLGRVASVIPASERRELEETSLAMERQLRDLREGVMRVRLVPVRDVFTRMRFVIRDLARETGKEVELHLTGEKTEVDKFVVERLADPLLHLVRNAVSHGLEPAVERVAAGKPPRGRIDLRASAAGGGMVIEVEDDGRGIDPEWVFSRARAVCLVAHDTPTDPRGVLDLICSPGFSTREGTDRASGRGVGMDVVARAVEDLGGTLSMSTEAGRGTRFAARLPLTLAITDALIVTVAGQAYAVPQSAVREVVEVEPGAITTMENNELLQHRGSVLPLVRLADVFGAVRPGGSFVAMVVDYTGIIALAADRVLGLREIVVRPLADPLVQVPGIAGATELGDGRAVLILDLPGLARHARSRRRPTA